MLEFVFVNDEQYKKFLGARDLHMHVSRTFHFFVFSRSFRIRDFFLSSLASKFKEP
jgi:hypothetical protein